METLRDDLRRAVRGLMRVPRLSLTVIATLALGIGVVTAFFSLLNALLFRPLPYDEPAELVRLQERSAGMFAGAVSPGVYAELKDADVPSLDGAAHYVSTTLNLTGPEWTDAVRGARVSPELLALLGARPALGRLPDADDAYTGAETVVVLGHDLWVRRFDGAKDVLGTTVRVDGAPAVVIGVMREGFAFPEWGEVWAPITDPDGGVSGGPMTVLGRLREGASIETADRDLSMLAERLSRAGVVPAGASLSVIAGIYDRQRGTGSLPWIFLVASGLVLLIVCSNIGSLLLARGAGRTGETAVRAALGASGGRLLLESLLEGAVLATAGGLLGLIVSIIVLDVFLAALAANFPFWFDPVLDLRVLGFTVLASTFSIVIFGLPPALQGARTDPARNLGGGRGVANRGGSGRLRKGLIVCQVALAFVLVVGGGLMARSVMKMAAVDTGMDAEEVYRVGLSLDGATAASDARRREFFDRARTRLRSVLGPAAHVGLEASHVGFLGSADSADAAALADSIRTAPIRLADGREFGRRDIARAVVSTNYFATVGLDLRRGRVFDDGDAVGAPLVGVLSETLAQRLWPGVDPLGRSLRLGGARGVDIQIAGIVEDRFDLDEGGAGGMRLAPEPILYLPEDQAIAMNRALLVRPGPGSGAVIAATLRSELRALDAAQAVSSVETIAEDAAGLIRAFAAIAALLVALAFAGGTLAAMGLYGLIAQGVADRTREIGIRRALGGSTRHIVGGVLRDGGRLMVVGLLAGLALALAMTRVLRSLLYEVEAYDPLVLIAAVILFAAIGWAASHLPARRAAGVQPMDALRAE